MKILLCNKFYYRRGGDCIYTLALEELLRSKGHEVAIFAMRHPDNLPTRWDRYFPDEVDFHNRRHLLKTLGRPLGLSRVAYKFGQLLDDFQPDVIHFNNIHSQLSPIIIRTAHRRGIPTVWTMHDYKLLCPRYDCLQQGQRPCTECYDDRSAVMSHRCMKGSVAASFLAYAEACRWDRRQVAQWVDAFIAPSDFMRRQLIAAGIPEHKVHHLKHFIDTARCEVPDYEKEDYYCFVGRLSTEKGVETLLRAAGLIDRPLRIIGDGPLRAQLEARYACDRITFTGFLPWAEIKEIVRHARCLVVPSEWYEVFGLVSMEALCLGTPVVGAHIGAIPEVIEADSGRLFTPGNVEELAHAVEEVCGGTYNYANIAHRATATYTADGYYCRLEDLYQKCING